MKNLLIIIFVTFAFNANAQNIFEIQDTESFEELQEIVNVEKKELKQIFSDNFDDLGAVKTYFVTQIIESGKGKYMMYEEVLRLREELKKKVLTPTKTKEKD